MKKILSSHWPYLPTSLALAAVLIIFWFVNQSYLGADRGAVALVLENPIFTFGLVIFGAYSGAMLSGEFSIKVPLTFEPLAMAGIGGFISGIGAVIAGMSTSSVVLFNLAGVFILPSFMISQGWIYAVFMILGGFAASKLLVLLISKIPAVKREITIPSILASKKNQRVTFYVFWVILLISGLIILSLPQCNITIKAGLVSAILFLILFGFIVERGRICMSSMLKEWFISKSTYIWRSVLFTLMCLALLYQIGQQLHLYEPIMVEKYVKAPGFLIFGSFLMGFGFIFADGCFIGSLWKAGEGNVINVISLFGLLMGIGVIQFVKTIFVEQKKVTDNGIPNYLSSVVSPFVLLIILWVVGVLLLIVFRQKRYRY